MATIEAIRTAAGRLTEAAYAGTRHMPQEQRPRWTIPPDPRDDDVIVSEGLDELAALREQHTRLVAALQRTTDGWLRVPDFGDIHCRYCNATTPHLLRADLVQHAEDCPVRVLADTQ